MTAEEAYWHACTNTPIDANVPELIRRAVACERRLQSLLKRPDIPRTWAFTLSLRRLVITSDRYGAEAAERITHSQVDLKPYAEA